MKEIKDLKEALAFMAMTGDVSDAAYKNIIEGLEDIEAAINFTP